MTDILLYDKEATLRIANRFTQLISTYENVQFSNSTIWFDGMYIKFDLCAITVNVLTQYPLYQNIINCLKLSLVGEELFLTRPFKPDKYIACVDVQTDLDSICFE